MKKIKNSALFKYILGLAVILRFWNLTVGDMNGDAPLYSFRALGWFDYLGGGQTTPIQWFSQLPWWANLSFHDAPPMVYFIQHIFYDLLGPTVFASRLPFVLAGIGTAIVMYYIAKEKNEITALWAFFIFSISSYAIWASRTGYLEGIEVLFISLSIFCFIKYLAGNIRKHLYLWGFFTGCALMSKYTSLFLLPSVFLYLVIWKRDLFKKKELWQALGILATVLLPLIIYNVMVFETRGHFDAALSSMVGMHPEDFVAISSRGVNVNFFTNFLVLFRTLYNNISLPLYLLSLLSLLYYAYKFIRKKTDDFDKFFAINILFIFFLFLFNGGEERWASIIVPFLVIPTSILIYELSVYLKNKKKILYRGLILFLIFSFAWELSYAIITNIAPRPFGRLYLNYSNGADYLKNNGWNQLDEYIKKDIIKTLPPMKKIKTIDDMGYTAGDLNGKEIIFYDDLVDWYTYSYYLQPYTLFYKYPVFPVSQAKSLAKNSDPFVNLKPYGVTGAYYIKTMNNATRDAAKLQNTELIKLTDEMEKLIEKNGATVKEIRNINGDLEFKVYHIGY